MTAPHESTGDISRAVWFDAPGVVAVRSERLGPPASGEERFEATLLGISWGTESLLFHGTAPRGEIADETLGALSGALDYPLKYGYQAVGTAGGMRVFAFAPHQQRINLPVADLIAVPEGITDADALFLASMETAIGIVHDARPRLGDVILVLGQGIIGLLTASLCRDAGMVTLVSDPLAGRSRLLSGVQRVPSGGAGDSGDEQVRRVHELTDGRGADVVIDTTGAPSALQQAIDAAATEGLIVAASWLGDRVAPLSLGRAFHRRRLSIRSSQVSRINPSLSPRWDQQRRFRLAFDWIERLRPAQFISHTFTIDDAPAAFAALADDQTATLQVVLEP